MDKRDAALQESCPTVIVPRYSDFVKSETIGDRLLIASNGVFIEVTRKWCYFIRDVGDLTVTVPYGKMNERTQFLMSRIPRHLLREFNELAKRTPFVEVGASIFWHEETGVFRLAKSESIVASSSFLEYKIATMSPGEHLLVDCHSHADGPAFFSETDDADDLHSVKFSYVAGDCNKTILSTVMRLCVKGIFTTIDTNIFFNEDNN